MNNVKVWKQGEYFAQQYLIKQGYNILDLNKKIANIEADIIAICPKLVLLKKLKKEYTQGLFTKESYIAQKNNIQDVLVIVEVKARTSNKYGNPAESVTQQKQMRLRKFAQAISVNDKFKNMPIRFDVISILADKIEHIENAF